MPAGLLRLVPALRPATGGQPERRGLLDLLSEAGEIHPSHLRQAGLLAARHESRLREILLAHAMVPEAALLDALARQWGLRQLDLGADPPDHRLIDRLGPETALRLGLLPWRRLGGLTVIATCWPEDFQRERPRLEALFGPVAAALAPEEEIVAALLAARARPLRDRALVSVAERESARNWRGERIVTAAAGLTGLAAAAAVLAPAALAFAVTGAAILALLAQAGLRTAAILARLPSLAAENRGGAEPSNIAIARRPVVSILVPMYKEPDIAPRLVARLSRLDYPRELLDILLVVEECDATTRAALSAAPLPPWMRVVVVPDGPVRTKPRAMNFALDFARGSIIGVYDAEDAPAPDQIARVVRRFADCGPQVACLQGVLDFYNAGTNWLSRCFTVEYAAWFRVILPGLQRLGLPLPLGGTTLFIRRPVLEELGRWDAHNVTEDADLGMRIARHGYRTEIIGTVTEEEANCRPLPWIRQRSRWQKGFMVTWAIALRDPGALVARIGLWPFLGMQLIFLGHLAQPLLAPVLWSFWALALGLSHPFAEALPGEVIWLLVGLFAWAEAANVAAGMLAVATPRRRWLLPWVPTLHVYYPLAALAAYKALYELAVRPYYWDKTAHGLFDGNAGLDDPVHDQLHDQVLAG